MKLAVGIGTHLAHRIQNREATTNRTNASLTRHRSAFERLGSCLLWFFGSDLIAAAGVRYTQAPGGSARPHAPVRRRASWGSACGAQWNVLFFLVLMLESVRIIASQRSFI